MKTFKIVLVVLILCFAFVGVTNVSSDSTKIENVKSTDNSEVIKIAEFKKTKIKKPNNI